MAEFNLIVPGFLLDYRSVTLYQEWLNLGNEGTMADFIAWLRTPATEAAAQALQATAEALDAAQTLGQGIAAAEAAATLANTKAVLANDAALLANEKAALVDSAATLANTKAGLADAAAILATDKAGLADSKATLANDKAALAQSAADNANAKAAEVTAAVLSAGQLGSIKPTDAAPTPARNGNYTFNIGGNKPAWLTAEPLVTTVKAGDGVAVVYTEPSSYTYTHVDTGNLIANELGTNEAKVINQKVVTEEFKKTARLEDETISATTTNAGLIIASSRLKTGAEIKCKLTSGATTNTGVSLYRQDGTFIQIGFFTSINSELTYKLLEDFISIKFYNNSNANGYSAQFIVKGTYSLLTDLQDSIDSLEDNVFENTNALSKIEDTIVAKTTLNTTIIITNSLLKKGRTINVYVENTAGSNISIFLYRQDNTNIQIGTLTALTTVISYLLLEDFVSIKFYNNSNADGYIGVLVVKNMISDIPKLRALVLGDSYSAIPTRWISDMMQLLPVGSSYISLAVGSATLKDKYSDLVTYPYSSRPASTDNSGNKNTLACQIQKLKRLMAGTDLDAGETKIYATPDTYPTVIIIEGGMNDSYDSDAVALTYSAQFSRQATNVYLKQFGGSASLGTVYIKTPIGEVNRTCFAGAYRYLVEELLKLFPSAQIFFTTASRLGYWTYDVNLVRSKTAAQQRTCAELCAATVIDWNKDGIINTIVNYPQGSGTVEDPYIWDKTVGNIDVNDAMHPNSVGAKKYGRIAAKVIKQIFINQMNDL